MFPGRANHMSRGAKAMRKKGVRRVWVRGLVAAAVLLCLSLWPYEGRSGFVKGPYLQALRTNGIVVVWQQENAGTGTVTINTVDYPSSGSGTIHKVEITGLNPYTTYDYTVTADGATDNGTFTTAPSDPLIPFRFIAMGDNRSNHDDHAKVVNAIIDEGPVDFIVNTADMVSSGDVEADWQFFFDIEYLLIKDTCFFPSVGNHEEEGGYLPGYYTDYLAPPTDTSGEPAYYSFTFANSAFIIMDGHVNVEEILFGLWDDFDSSQKAWLDSLLQVVSADPAIQHIFVFNHEPPYSSKDGRSGNHAFRLLIPSFVQNGVDAVIHGHDHYLERGESPDGMRYFIMGGGGAPLYENTSEGNLGSKTPTALPWLDDAHTVHYAKMVHGYMIVDIFNGQVDVQIREVTGTSQSYTVVTGDTLSWNTGDVTPADGGVEQDGAAGPDGSGPSDGAVDPDAVAADGGPPGLDGTVIPPDEADSGCGCRTVSRAGTSPAAWILAALALLALVALRRNP